VREIFLPGASTEDIIQYIRDNVKEQMQGVLGGSRNAPEKGTERQNAPGTFGNRDSGSAHWGNP
jgi:hypothetical protein